MSYPYTDILAPYEGPSVFDRAPSWRELASPQEPCQEVKQALADGWCIQNWPTALYVNATSPWLPDGREEVRLPDHAVATAGWERVFEIREVVDYARANGLCDAFGVIPESGPVEIPEKGFARRGFVEAIASIRKAREEDAAAKAASAKLAAEKVSNSPFAALAALKGKS